MRLACGVTAVARCAWKRWMALGSAPRFANKTRECEIDPPFSQICRFSKNRFLVVATSPGARFLTKTPTITSFSSVKRAGSNNLVLSPRTSAPKYFYAS